MTAARLKNGTTVAVEGSCTVVVLPCGRTIRGRPQGTQQQAETARVLGYGEDVGAMVADHDPLHALLCDWLGLSTSVALSDPTSELASYEEAAVLAVQRFMKLAGGRVPLCRSK